MVIRFAVFFAMLGFLCTVAQGVLAEESVGEILIVGWNVMVVFGIIGAIIAKVVARELEPIIQDEIAEKKEKYNIVLPGDKVEKEEDEENEDEANAQKEESKETGEATEEASLSEAQAYAAAPSNYTEAPGNGAQAYAATPSNGIAPANGETVANGTAASAAS